MRPVIDGDRLAGTVAETMTILAARLPGGWTEHRGHAFAGFTGLGLPTLNGVLCRSPWADPADVDALLHRVRATGVPHSLQLRPGSPPGLSKLADRLGMSAAGQVPAMVLEDAAPLSAALAAPVAVRLLAPGERVLHLAVAAAGFGIDTEVLAPLVEALDMPGVRLYVGEVDGHVVVTGASLRVGDAVGLFNVATVASHRRRGYAGVLSARAVLDGLSGGARWAFLQSSPMGQGVYARLGFRTVERWELWSGGP